MRDEVLVWLAQGSLPSVGGAVGASSNASSMKPSPLTILAYCSRSLSLRGRRVFGTRLLWADFFTDLGGHSLFAARLASALRTDPRFAHITVRDIYQNRTVGRIAEALDQAHAPGVPVDASWLPPPRLRRWTCGVAQAAVIPGLVALHMASGSRRFSPTISLPGILKTQWRWPSPRSSVSFCFPLYWSLLSPLPASG
ncbi:acyl carrier protein [Polaromonas hydrogenivorans]|uniref:acyl carrier protein n=1 Tax=Polaromonas hydrogenivorans TaxID=335476 RepID=UPI0039EE8386